MLDRVGQREQSRIGKAEGAPERVRAAVLDYLNSRLELKKCIAQLTGVSHRLPAFREDRTALDAALQSMRFNYSGQTPYVLTILISLIDKNANQAEQNLPVP